MCAIQYRSMAPSRYTDFERNWMKYRNTHWLGYPSSLRMTQNNRGEQMIQRAAMSVSERDGNSGEMSGGAEAARQ